MNMREWADLYGEWDTGPKRPSSLHVWCDNCQYWVDPIDFKRFTGDDQLHWLCPGCDGDMVEPELME